jgi:hypothetical protein
VSADDYWNLATFTDVQLSPQGDTAFVERAVTAGLRVAVLDRLWLVASMAAARSPRALVSGRTSGRPVRRFGWPEAIA